MKLFDRYVNRITEELTTLLIKRHEKYGEGNIQKHGLEGILVRLDDKLARLEHGVADHDDESLEDTLRDVAGYAIVGLMWVRGQWPGSPYKAGPLGPGGVEDPIPYLPDQISQAFAARGEPVPEELKGRAVTKPMCMAESHIFRARCELPKYHELPHKSGKLTWNVEQGVTP